MLRWALGFFVIALLAALLGFTDIAAGAAWAGQTLFFIFVVFFLVIVVGGLLGRSRHRVIRVRVHQSRKTG
jgi:uncharacterized membrane protein YtjA (UPF0391 family)